MLKQSYHRILKRLAKRIENGQSIRGQAQKLRLSHEGLRGILKNPNKASRKTMIKIVRTIVRRKSARRFNRPVGLWIGDAI